METNSKHVNISKLDAAKRQLEFSIRLFFRNSDIVVIHTLAAASHTILRDSGKRKGVKSLIKDYAVAVIKKEKQKEFLKMINKAENFFKHADKDGDQQLKFYFQSTAFLILDACEMYQKITMEIVPLLAMFRVWFMLRYPELILDEQLRLLTEKFKSDLNPEDKSSFLEMLPLLEKKLLS